LSSSFSAFDTGAGDLMPLRARLLDRGDKLGAEVVLAEREPTIEAAAKAADHIRVLEGCANLAADCDAFFGVIFQRHGTRIDLAQDSTLARAEVSFFEAELLSACVSNKPVMVVVVRNAPPGDAMANFLILVRTALGELLVECDESGVTQLFEDFARAVIRGTTRPPPWLLDSVSGGRMRRQVSAERKRPSLAFLGGVFRGDGAGAPDEAVIEAALRRAEAKLDDAGLPLAHITRLSYLWVAMREFAKNPRALRDQPLRSSFQQGLGLWNSSAAWRGLHGAHPMGCLASLSDLAHSVRITGHGLQPHGARASAYYSVGAKVRDRRTARRFFKTSAALATHAIRQSGNSAGFSMRASALARLALLGDRLLYFDALRDYRRELELRERQSAGPSERGEAATEYAYALGMQRWRRQEAIRRMREGVALMAEGEETRADFLVRAERKFGEMLLSAGQLDEALAVADSALEKAVARTSLDQEQQVRDLKQRISAQIAARRR
jgi:hypothetical protein